MTQRLLIIEDNPIYIQAAKKVFLNARFAHDYVSAVQKLDSDIGEILTDCFFPYQVGSKHTRFGLELVDELEPFARLFEESLITRALEKTAQDIGYQLMKGIAKRTHNVDLQRDFGYKRALIEEIALDEANQPLGIQIGHLCEQNELPFALVTSTHHHDFLTEPVQKYAISKGWNFIDCPKDNPDYKANPKFWIQAYKRMRG